MHWARASVNPMLSLRNAVCNDRWDEAWQQSAAHIQQFGLVRRAVQAKRVAAPEGATPVAAQVVVVATEAAPDPAVGRKKNANHPWRRTNYATRARMAEAKAGAKL
jgi:hypothetical protein